jgi:hypothetical protein
VSEDFIRNRLAGSIFKKRSFLNFRGNRRPKVPIDKAMRRERRGLACGLHDGEACRKKFVLQMRLAEMLLALKMRTE